MSSKSQHIVPTKDGSWAVRKTGAARATRVFHNQQDAIRYGRDLAKRESAELFVHRKDGTIEHADSYGRESNPSKG